MINTKALTIRFGYSRFWKVKFISNNFYENYHQIYLDNYVRDFFSQRIFHLIGFVYGHSVIKYFYNHIRVEVFVHDFRLEEFLKTFFKFSKKNTRKRIFFRKKIFRPFFRKFFRFSTLDRSLKRHNNFTNSRYNYFHSKRPGKFPFKGHFSNKIVGADRNYNKFINPNISKKFFSGFRTDFNIKSSNNFRINTKKNFRRSGVFNHRRPRNIYKKGKPSYLFRSFFNFFKNLDTIFKKIKFYKLRSLKSSTRFSNKKFFKICKILFNCFKFLNFFLILRNNFSKGRFFKSFASGFSRINFAYIVKFFSSYSRYKLFSSYKFLHYSKKFISKHLPKKMSKKLQQTFKSYRFRDFSGGFLNVKYSSYFMTFLRLTKTGFVGSVLLNSKIFNFSKFSKTFFSNYSFSPKFYKSFSYSNYISNFPTFSTIFAKSYSKKSKYKRFNSARILPAISDVKVNDPLFRFIKRKRRRKLKRPFLPFFSRFKRLSYTYFRFFRFKFFKFISFLFSRGINKKFLGLPVRLFIRVIPAYRTTVNIFLRYFITKLFYRYMLGDVINPIVRSSIRRFRGFTVVANGRFTRAQIASHKQYKRGSVSFSSISIPIDYNQMCVPLKYGTCNLKLWIRY